MTKFLKQLFCKHEYEAKEIKGGFLVVDGWLTIPVQYVCTKCGKIKKEG